MIAFFARRPVLVTMLYAGLVILGVVSYQRLSIEGQPDTELPQLVVDAPWNNASPEVVQVFLASPIEEVAAQLEGVEEITSSSNRRGATVRIKFSRETPMDFARLDLNERLSTLRSDLPPGAQQPQITMVESGPIANTQFMSFNISGPYDVLRLSEIVQDHLKNELWSLDGIADVRVYGEREKQLKIQLDRAAMELFQIIPEQVYAVVSELSRPLETARITLNQNDYTIHFTNSIPDLASLENLIIHRTNNHVVKLKDIGSVSLGYSEPMSLSRLNGNPTLKVTLEKEMGAHVIETSTRVRECVNRILADLPSNLRLDWVDDEGELMKEQLQAVYHRGVWCLILITLLLLLAVQSIRATAVITLNILFSVMITVTLMYLFGITVNIVTLSGLAIGFGMLVDNAIVIMENIFRLRENGVPPRQAAMEGAREVVSPIFAATLTTVAAFVCMSRLEDRLAVTYWPMAQAVIFSLTASLFVSFTFTPVLSMIVSPGGSRTSLQGVKTGLRRRAIQTLLDRYTQLVRFCLHHKLFILTVTAAFFIMFQQIWTHEIDRGGFVFGFGRDDRVVVVIRMPEGAELETTDQVIRMFEEPLLTWSGYKDVDVRVYQNIAVLNISFDNETLASPKPLMLKARLVGIAQNIAGVGVTVAGINPDDNYFTGFTGFESYNSTVHIMGYNYKRLMEIGDDILKRVKRQRRVNATKLETTGSRFGASDLTETVLNVNRIALQRESVDVEYLLAFLSRHLRLEATTRTRFQGEEMLLEIKFSHADDFDIKALENLVILLRDGRRVRMADLVDLETRNVSGGIDRKDQQYRMAVKWNYRGSAKKARRYNEAVFESLDLPAGYSAEMEFTEYLTREEDESLAMMMGLAVLLVVMIIAALYESFIDPIIIFLTMPMAFMGVSWIYWYTGQSFDSTAYTGLIILAGIVVNNAILLVSHTNQCVKKGAAAGISLHDAVCQAARDRFRPVLLTATTTIVGLLPLLEEFVHFLLWNPVVRWFRSIFHIPAPTANLENTGLQVTLDMFANLSRSTVGGMLTATLSTLILIPVVYLVLFRFKQWWYLRRQELSAMQNKEPPS